jgi:hypothetical protein
MLKIEMDSNELSIGENRGLSVSTVTPKRKTIQINNYLLIASKNSEYLFLKNKIGLKMKASLQINEGDLLTISKPFLLFLNFPKSQKCKNIV